MNSDPYDSAAWRAFGMLDSDESEMFDEATRTDPGLSAAAREMNGMAAAIAAACSTPLLPKAGQLDQIRERVMEGRRPARRIPPVVGYAGWGIAAVLALMLFLRSSPETDKDSAGSGATDALRSTPVHSGGTNELPAQIARTTSPEKATGNEPAPDVATGLAQNRTTTRAETKRLIQEIEVLRENLERFQQRDRAVFETVPGRAWPIVMTMSPPGVTAEETEDLALLDDPFRITTMLGDALTSMNQRSTMGAATLLGTNPDETMGETPVPEDPAEAEPDYPSAIPIYDAARDSGTLVVSKLPPTQPDEAYNLWVTTENGNAPIFVGSLPVSGKKVEDSFDFSLGSNMVLPTGFLLTRDPIQTPVRPNSENIVLEGPPTGVVE